MKTILSTIFATLFALTLFTACGDDIAPCVAGVCAFDGGSWDEECDLGGSCSVTVTDGADVTFSCPDGDCAMSCDGADSCILDCPDGSCSLNCTATATCKITNCSDSCALNCTDATVCESNCDTADSCATTNY
ncbi:hypothetical protein KAI87_03495 [Myxococcota bacterium]|nr:hypothetical protein [Myxococcota bacterium]